MSLTWTSPTRRVGERLLPFLANEMYLSIFDYFRPSDGLTERQSRRILLSLSRVCRFFRAVTIPHIFHTIRFEFPNSLAVEWQNCLHFCKALDLYHEPAVAFALYVKNCLMGPSGNSTMVPGYPGCMVMYSRAIPCLGYLESLSLSSMPIQCHLFQGIKTMKHLKVFSIQNCGFGDAILSTDAVAFSLIKFELFGTSAIPDDLYTFINPVSLRALKTDNWEFTKVLLSKSADFRIEELSVHLPIAESSVLVDFLNRTPSITNLSIPHVTHTVMQDLTACNLTLLPASLPRLETVQCPIFMLTGLVPGRPVKQVDLHVMIVFCGTRMFPDNFSPMASLEQSTAIITTLRVPAYVYSTISFGDPFLHLRKLIVCPTTDPKSLRFMEEFRRGWLHTPPIHELVLEQATPAHNWWKGQRCNLRLQYQILTTVVVPELPSLCRMSFTEEVCWKMEDTNVARWEPVVPMRFHERVKEWVTRGEEHVTDFNGVFASLFQACEIT